jgi:hypothetical protein
MHVGTDPVPLHLIEDVVGSFNLLNFEAQSHGPPTDCLRCAGGRTPRPKARFMMAGQPCPGGSGYALGPIEAFRLFHRPFPGFAGALQNSKRVKAVPLDGRANYHFCPIIVMRPA